MLEKFVCAPKTLRRLRAGPSGPYIDGFADALVCAGYSGATALRYLRAAAHLGCFVQRVGTALEAVDTPTLEAFARHFAGCRCPQSHGGSTGYHAYFGAKLFQRHLVQLGVCRAGESIDEGVDEPRLVMAFRDWLQAHRGASKPTVRLYARDAT